MILTGVAIIGAAFPIYQTYSQDSEPADPVKITALDGQAIKDDGIKQVPRCIHVVRGTGRVENGHHLWVGLKSFAGGERGQVQRVRFAREAHTQESAGGREGWLAYELNVGGEDQTGSTSAIVLLDLDSRTNKALSGALIGIDDLGVTTKPGGRDLWRLVLEHYPTGVRQVDEVSVTRKSGDKLSCDELASRR
ncbi:hypothetical protein [Streptomyces sp. NPDC057257]|uniref:hypothetical protein n=1 Tax=Streptomyces sp. NPDC057257 TaxID=3346071 RepID=UPI00362DC36C